LFEALSQRHSIREYAVRPLPPQVLSDLLWAGFGIYRPNGDQTVRWIALAVALDVVKAALFNHQRMV